MDMEFIGELNLMQSRISKQQSKSDQIFAILLATFSMFTVGYTATRVFLTRSSQTSVSSPETVIPHQATLWSDLGK